MTRISFPSLFSRTSTAGANNLIGGGQFLKNEFESSFNNGYNKNALPNMSYNTGSVFDETLGDLSKAPFTDAYRGFSDSLCLDSDGGVKQAINNQDTSSTASSPMIGQGGYTQSQADQDAAALYEATRGGLTGFGTDEDKVFSSLQGKNSQQVQMIRSSFKDHYQLDLDQVVRDEMSGKDLQRAKSLLAGNSYQHDGGMHQDASKAGSETPPAMQTPTSPRHQAEASAEILRHAMDGLGTDEDALRSELNGKSKEQIDTIATVYAEKYGRDLRHDLTSELDGRDKFELVDQSFDQGAIDANDPKAAQKTAQRLREQQAFENGIGSRMVDGIQTVIKGESDSEILNRNLERAETAIREGDLDKAQTLFGYAGNDIQALQESKDSLADGAATVTTTAVTVTAVVATGGAATPLALAAYGALGAGTRATTYMAIEGDAGGGQEVMRQGALGFVEGGTAVLPVGKGATLGKQALKEGAEQSVGKLMVQGAKEGFVGGAASGAVNASTRSETWENGFVDGLVTVGEKTALDGTIGAVTGAGVSGGIANTPKVWRATKESFGTFKHGISGIEIPQIRIYDGLQPAMLGAPGNLSDSRQTVGDFFDGIRKSAEDYINKIAKSPNRKNHAGGISIPNSKKIKELLDRPISEVSDSDLKARGYTRVHLGDGKEGIRRITADDSRFAKLNVADGKIILDADIPTIHAKYVDNFSVKEFTLTAEQNAELKDLLARRDRLIEERDKLPYGSSAYNKINSGKIAPLSAKVGEKTSDFYVKGIDPNFERIHPVDLNTSPSKSGNFDLVYRNKDTGEVWIVEAKAGVNPKLGTKKINGADYEQGTTEYFAAITEMMDGKMPKPGASPETRAAIDSGTDAASVIIKAADNEKVKYMHIESLLSNNPSTLKDIRIGVFDIDQSTVKNIKPN